MQLCCGGPDTDPIVAGALVHRIKKADDRFDVRVGGAERYIVKYASPYTVVIEARRMKDGSFITEFTEPRKKFDEMYERCPGA